MENTSMNASQEDLHKIERQLTERIHTVQLEATKMSVRRRNEAVIVLLGLGAIITILSLFRIESFVEEKINDIGGKKIESWEL